MYVPLHRPFQKLVGEYLFETNKSAIDKESDEQTVYADAFEAG